MVSTNLLQDPSVGGLVHNISDITDARQAEDRLRYEATHDPLTQLANRSLFNERVQFADDTDESLAILAIDLDDFKAVNDTLGHHVGDGLLVAVADRIRRCVRPGDTVARLGGDEFAVVLPGATPDDAAAIGQRIRRSVEQPVAVDSHLVTVAASVGIAVGPARDAERLSQAADSAMYRAKQTNQNPYVTRAPTPTRARP
jgi:diguanylate cyclase (GGDEF)-like protein